MAQLLIRESLGEARARFVSSALLLPQQCARAVSADESLCQLPRVHQSEPIDMLRINAHGTEFRIVAKRR